MNAPRQEFTPSVAKPSGDRFLFHKCLVVTLVNGLILTLVLYSSAAISALSHSSSPLGFADSIFVFFGLLSMIAGHGPGYALGVMVFVLVMLVSFGWNLRAFWRLVRDSMYH